MKYVLCIAATFLIGVPVASAQYPGQYGGQAHTKSVIRPVGHAALWNDYGNSYGTTYGGAGCGCATPAPSCCGPVGGSACGSCNSCNRCCKPILQIIPCAIKRFGRALDCLLPCNTRRCGGCGLGLGHGASCCSSCSGGVPAMEPYSDPFIDDPVQTMPMPSRTTPPAPPKDVRNSPMRSSPLAIRSQAVRQQSYEPAPIKVASHALRPIPATRHIESSAARGESSVLKRISLESDIDPAYSVANNAGYDAAPVPPSQDRQAVQPSARMMQQFDIPVNPLR